MKIIYLDGIEEVIAIHNKTIKASGGGLLGIVNTGALESALAHIQNDDYYPDFVDKLTHLFFSANKSHCFTDGNKRIAITLCTMFLLKNGYLFISERFLNRTEMISYQVAKGKISKELLRKLIQSILYEEDYSEELKLELASAIADDF